MSELERIATQIERWARFDDVAPAGLPEAAIIRKAADENQRLEADLDRTTTAGNRIEQQLVEASSVMAKLRDENQRLREKVARVESLVAAGHIADGVSVSSARVIREALAGDAE